MPLDAPNAAVPPAPLRILLLAGEVSGDLHASDLLRELREALAPRPLEVYGIGGDRLAAMGMELLAHTDQTGVIGFWEVFKRARFFKGLLKKVTRLLDERRPDLVLGIDYPGFNLRIEAQAKARGIPVAHYVCPQVWAWRRGRIPKVARSMDLLVTLFPFEPDLFKETSLKTVFAGNPLVDQTARTRREFNAWKADSASEFRLPWGPGRRIALFPGSRPNEVHRLLPDILAAAVQTEAHLGDCSFLIPTPTEGVRALVEAQLALIPQKPRDLRVVLGESRQALLEAEAAVVKSGTSTLEATLLGCPQVIVYRVSECTYRIFKRLVTGVKHISLVNILAQREVCRELIQHDLTPETLAHELTQLLSDSAVREKMLSEMQDVAASLGPEGASKRAAQAVVNVLLCE